MSDVRCPRCDRYICSVPGGTTVQSRCRDCKLKFELITPLDIAVPVRR